MSLTKNTQNSYDLAPYASKSFKLSLPYQQKAVMQLLGFRTPNLENARVLEIGCSFGGNIMSYALAYPNSQCVGIDLSEVQIKRGKELIKKFGIKNLELHAKDILEYKHEFGKFDYIVCHGVFSWVPDVVKEKILEVIKEGLTENGTAMISYNTYPGWKTIDVVRNMMLFRIEELKDKGFEVNESDLVNHAVDVVSVLHSDNIADIYKHHISSIDGKDVYYIRHEHLEEYNDPMYLYEFNKLANKYNLFHVCDSEINKTFPAYNPKIEEILDGDHNKSSLVREQYYDFLYNREFRMSIITHTKNKDKINIDRNIRLADLDNIYIKGKFNRDENGLFIVTNNIEYSQELLAYIDSAYPNVLKVSNIVKDFKDKVNDIADIYTQIASLLYCKLVDYSSIELKTKHKKKPKLKSTYRNYFKYLLETKKPEVNIGDYTGSLVKLEPHELIIISYFDGKRTVEDIVKLVLEELKKEDGLLTFESKRDDANLEEAVTNLVLQIKFYLETEFFVE